jgi:hypothetical protein
MLARRRIVAVSQAVPPAGSLDQRIFRGSQSVSSPRDDENPLRSCLPRLVVPPPRQATRRHGEATASNRAADDARSGRIDTSTTNSDATNSDLFYHNGRTRIFFITRPNHPRGGLGTPAHRRPGGAPPLSVRDTPPERRDAPANRRVFARPPRPRTDRGAPPRAQPPRGGVWGPPRIGPWHPPEKRDAPANRC